MVGSRGYIESHIGCVKPTLRNFTVFFKGLDYMRKDKDSSASAARAVMVMQIGARRNYFGARQLEAAGLLHSLVCDAAWPADQLSWLARLAPQVKPRLASAIKRRTVVGIDPSRLHATLFPNLASVSKLIFPQEQAFTVVDEALGLAARLKGLSGVRVVVNCFGNGGSFSRACEVQRDKNRYRVHQP